MGGEATGQAIQDARRAEGASCADEAAKHGAGRAPMQFDCEIAAREDRGCSHLVSMRPALSDGGSQDARTPQVAYVTAARRLHADGHGTLRLRPKRPSSRAPDCSAHFLWRAQHSICSQESGRRPMDARDAVAGRGTNGATSTHKTRASLGTVYTHVGPAPRPHSCHGPGHGIHRWDGINCLEPRYCTEQNTAPIDELTFSGFERTRTLPGCLALAPQMRRCHTANRAPARAPGRTSYSRCLLPTLGFLGMPMGLDW